jgi:hypothetical protein
MTLCVLHLESLVPTSAQPGLSALIVAEAAYLVAAREHYTVDVLVAVPIAMLVFLASESWV